MGVVGGLLPSPLHFIALAQVGLGRWRRAVFVLWGPPLLVDGALLLVTFFFYDFILQRIVHHPQRIAHDVSYAGGAVTILFGIYSLIESRRKKREELVRSAQLTYAGVSVAMLGEVAAPGTWVYWLTIAGPILAEGRARGYGHVVPFFAAGLVCYYGAALASVWVMAWGASLHREFKSRLFMIANALLIVWGIFYILRAYLSR
jgi:hypothetical protein